MKKTINLKTHCVQTVSKGMFWILAYSKADALARWAQMYPKTPVKNAWRSNCYYTELPVDRVLV